MTPSLNTCSPAKPSAGTWTRPFTHGFLHLVLLVGLNAAWTHPLHANWPQFLGPQRDGTAPAIPRGKSWASPDQAEKPRWNAKVGAGFSGPILLKDRVLLFHRIGDQDVLEAFQLGDGKSLWKLETPTRYVDDFGFDEGPRATPASSSNVVVTLSAEGHVQAADISTGKRLWEIPAQKQFNARKGFFGLASSPLILQDTVIAMVGGTDKSSILGIDLHSGKIRWKSGDDESSYASPVATTWQGKTRALILTRESLVALAPETGAILWSFPWRPPMHASVSAATPLIQGDQVFLSASYGTPAVLLRCNEAGPTEIWRSAKAMANHYATCVLHEGFLYGFHGRQESGCDLRCTEWATGKIQWTQEGFGAGTLIKVGQELLILAESGELIRAQANPQSFKETSRFQALGAKTRAHAAYSDGLFVARSPRELVCLDLIRR